MQRTSQFRPVWKLSAAILLSTLTLAPSALAQEPAPKAQAGDGASDPRALEQPKHADEAASEDEGATPPAARRGEDRSTNEGSKEPNTDASTSPQESSTPSPEQREAARLAFEEGSLAFEQGQYTEAASAFQRARGLIPSPHAEYWIALSLDKGDPEDTEPATSAAAYRQFLNNPGAQHVGADELLAAQKRYEQLRSSLPATVTITTEPKGASLSVDGEPQEGVTPSTFEVRAGTYEVSLSLEGHEDVTVFVQAEGGSTVEQEVTLVETPPPAVPEPEPKADEAEEEPRANLVPAFVTLGLGGAGLISGTVFGIMALNSKSKFKDDPTTAHADAAERNALIADMSFGIALTLGITGVVLLTAKDGDVPSTAKAKSTEFVFAPYASPRGAGAAARWTF